MKRTLVLTLLVFSTAAVLRADVIKAGNHEFRADVASDFENNKGYSSLPVYGGVGYFFADNLEGGLYFSLRKSKWESYWGPDTAWGLGVFGEYDVARFSAVVPFVSARIGVLDGDRTDDTTLNVGAGVGMRFLLTESLSLAIQVEYEWADKEVFNFNRLDENKDEEMEPIGSGDPTSLTARAGIRLLF